MQEYDAIARLKQGDISGLETLVRNYQLKAVRTAYLIVRDYDLVRMLLQMPFCVLMNVLISLIPNDLSAPGSCALLST